MIWWILGLGCLGLVVLFVALLVYGGIADAKEEQLYLREATPVLGWIVQANSVLYSRGGASSPAQILVSFESVPDEKMAELALRLSMLKRTDPTNPIEAEVAALVNDESYRPYERFRLPTEFTGGPEVYSMHIWVRRDKLPDHMLTLPFVRCLAFPDRPDTRPRMIEYTDSDLDYRERDSNAPPHRPWEH
jgi:hypothetical protein